MQKRELKKFLIGALIALQLNFVTNPNSLRNVYAQEIEEESDNIYLEENGKELLLIAITYKDYKYITVGYKFPKDNAIWVKDAIDVRSYNMNRISEFLNYPELVYTEIENVLPGYLKNRVYLTKDEAIDLISDFRVVETKTQLYDGDGLLYDFYYQTFEKQGFNNADLHIANSSLFENPYDVFNSSTLEDNYDENKEIINEYENNFKLGFFENPGIYKCYKTIYDEKEINMNSKGGIITRFYVFDEVGKYITSLYTQKQIDAFISEHQDNLASYTWKAAIHLADNAEETLIDIQNNQVVPSSNITYFISYKPKTLAQKKPNKN